MSEYEGIQDLREDVQEEDREEILFRIVDHLKEVQSYYRKPIHFHFMDKMTIRELVTSPNENNKWPYYLSWPKMKIRKVK